VNGAVRRRLVDGRWHFQHGPIDCIVLAEGEAGAAAECIERAWSRFRGVLDELVGELPLLRTDLGSPDGASVAPCGSVARRMVAACRVHASGGRFITAMAAVAGSVDSPPSSKAKTRATRFMGRLSESRSIAPPRRDANRGRWMVWRPCTRPGSQLAPYPHA